jgi:Replication-relaxation
METVPYQLGLLPMARTPLLQPKQSAQKLTFAVTPVHDLLLRSLNTLHLATAEQLCRLNYRRGMLTTVQTRLKDLVDHGYCLVLSQPTIRGRAAYVYTLARKGLNHLAAQGIEVPDYFRPSEEREREANFLFLSHSLALTDVLVAADLFLKAEPAYTIQTLLHERTLKRTPFHTSFARNGKTERFTLIPDAYMEFWHRTNEGREEPIPVYVEVDRGTEDQKFFRKRIRSYSVFVTSQAYRSVANLPAITIAFATTKGEKRVAQMREWTRRELAATSEPKWLADLFLFTHLPEEIEPRHLFLAPVWYVPSDDSHPVSLLGE